MAAISLTHTGNQYLQFKFCILCVVSWSLMSVSLSWTFSGGIIFPQSTWWEAELITPDVSPCWQLCWWEEADSKAHIVPHSRQQWTGILFYCTSLAPQHVWDFPSWVSRDQILSKTQKKINTSNMCAMAIEKQDSEVEYPFSALLGLSWGSYGAAGWTRFPSAKLQW